ncbi:unnamed protein product [Brassicogethes aeneus]|uniref:Uncharacterized protein n=1 Tax=Brassicogethes aeneus TaxID=1431903 RepID=A0A9P0FDE3_BRAAE|nr:unnamed protein product [Brassicogethes aeneus]
MKILVLLCFVVVGVVTGKGKINEEDMAKLLKLSEECKKETGIDETISKKARMGEFVEDAKLKEQIFCVNKKSKIQDESGKFLIENIKSYINKYTNSMDKTNEIVEKCFKEKDTAQQSAFEAAKCMHPMVA